MFIFVFTLLVFHLQDAPKPMREPAEQTKGNQTESSPDGVVKEQLPENGLYRVGQVGVDPPVFTKKVTPIYPKEGSRLKLEGYVVLEATFKTDGTVEDIRVLRGLGRGKFGFEQNAIDALRQWEFKPGKYQGIPADIKMTLKIDYIMKKEW